MSKLYSNPFVWGIPVSGNHYVARPEDEKQIQSCIDTNQPVILTGHRGSGKTSLVQHVAGKSQSVSMYLDLSFVVGMASMVDLMKRQIKAELPELKESPILKADSQDSAEAFAQILQLLFDRFRDKEKKLLIIWDEFHHILKLKEDVLGALKKHISGRRGLHHLLVSHRQDLMRQVFNSKGDRFFSNPHFMHLENLPRESFRSYLTRNFRRMGLNDFDLADSVLTFMECQPLLTQKYAHAIARCWLEGTTSSLMEKAGKKLMAEVDASFADRWDGFGVNEKRLILGLANGFSRPTELGFIEQFGLAATSTAHNTVLKLLKEGWLINRDDGYYIYDPLFLKWLKDRNSIS